MTNPTGNVQTVKVSVSDYILSTKQIVNLASEFYGQGLDIPDKQGKIELVFGGISAKSNSEQFKKYIDNSFIRNQD